MVKELLWSWARGGRGKRTGNARVAARAVGGSVPLSASCGGKLRVAGGSTGEGRLIFSTLKNIVPSAWRWWSQAAAVVC